LPFDPRETNFIIPIDKVLSKKNLLVEVSSDECGTKKIKPYYSASLRVRMFENFGELKVFIPQENGNEKPLPKSYVKVYQKNNSGQVKFFKDGYTDLRGRFDYATLSGSNIADI